MNLQLWVDQRLQIDPRSAGVQTVLAGRGEASGFLNLSSPHGWSLGCYTWGVDEDN